MQPIIRGELETDSDGSEATALLVNDLAVDGHIQEPGPLTWLNSARITTTPDDDSVCFFVSVGDPRGAFCFTVRRLTDGRLMIHTPHPGETCPHEDTEELWPGTLVVGTRNGDGFKPADFSDEEPEASEA